MSALSDTKSETVQVDVASGLPSHARDDLERRLVRKLDLRVSVIALLYALNNIDKGSISSARLGGFEKDLHLRGSQYPALLAIVYVGFAVMQLPGNMFLHWLERPAILIPCSMVIWGLASALTGITQNYTQVLLARLILGFAEASLFPGAIFLLSVWYKRDELAVRATLISCGSMFSNGFGSLWLFYIEGGITIIVAIGAMFILPSFPHNTKWLTPEERSLAISRLADDGYGTLVGPGKKTTIQGLWDSLLDWKVWWFAVTLFIYHIALSFGAYFPTIVATMGYDTKVTLLLGAPPWLLAMIGAFTLSRYSDSAQKRCIYICASNVCVAVGFVTSMCTMNTVARYFSLFLMAQSTAGQMVLWAWIKNTFTREPAKRASAIAVIGSISSVGSIAASFVWPLNWGPTYLYSYMICSVALVVSTVMLGVMHWHLKRENEKIEKNERNAGNILQDPVKFRYLV
ncbi:hypothetical protein CY34DRAFT_14582 [Suillus luteus UH-Slu-Lm8-n1]|uniref:Unplaced genomic scaffold CY34scaffold_225, whole genome shotgun sequence n=1 Tax=Suillus luteus UH-Slu-Lm8-n1 TaxID=930992 RepID=A0A0C9ZNE6_9AGAM|nr:hypothetical protein CY34DRAFT_14582 [Suillus luteus UH-Slu-Lm8-n1]